MTVLEEIRVERARQNQQWGGRLHDEHHQPMAWIGLLTKHLGRGAAAIFDKDWPQYRHRLIIVASLAVAAIEAYDSLHAEASAGSPFVSFTEDAEPSR